MKTGKKKTIKSFSWKRILGLWLVAAMLLTNSVSFFGWNVKAESETTQTDTGASNNSRPDQSGEQNSSLNMEGEVLAELQAEEQRAAVQLLVQNEEAGEVVVTLNLNGGRINGLEFNGWSYGAGAYYRKADAGQPFEIANPYRAGYTFKGWKMEGSDTVFEPSADRDSIAVSVAEDCSLTAVWEERFYSASFQNGKDEVVWTVHVPYGSILWTRQETPWEDGSIDWTELSGVLLPAGVTKAMGATVAVSLGTGTAESDTHDVQVTRFTQENGAHYYTFILEDTPYFTYGGDVPEYTGHNFVGWQASGLSGFSVTEDGKKFQAQYTIKKSYLFYVYYYFENGTKASDPETIVVPEEDVTKEMISLKLPVPSVRHYSPTAGTLPEGITVAPGSQTESGWTGDVAVNVKETFPDDAESPGVSIIVMYTPKEIDYKVIYHVQKVGDGTTPDDYDEIGFLMGRAKIGSVVSVIDCPKKLTGADGSEISTDFKGCEADLGTQAMIRRGQRLESSMIDDSDIAVIHAYYNRSYYYLYTLTDTNESDPFDPVRVQYGAQLPEDQDGTKLVKTGYLFDGWSWFQAGVNGTLQGLGDGSKPSIMPGHDIYAVASWKVAKTKMQVVYWFEDANSGSFQNTYQKEVENVPTGDKLLLCLEPGKYDLKTENPPIQSFPAFTETFEEAVCSKYGADKASYKQYFTFDPETTFAREEENHHATGNNGHTELHYEVKADGTTTINLYYRRNLYTLQFVIQRNNGNTRQIATSTSGTFLKCGWQNLLGSADSVFQDFKSEQIVRTEPESATFGSASILQEYRIKDAVARGDDRAAVGRYATVRIGTYPCRVYYLTARFEADIAELWPTMENISTDPKAYYSKRPQYISMGSNLDSTYYQGKANKNILNKYSSMDATIVNDKNGNAYPDNQKNATVTHQLYAYWANSNVKTYTYYFLYETLDTTLNPNDYPVFSAQNASTYKDGTIVKWKNGLYVYRTNGVSQNSTNWIENQNQPARYGYDSLGKEYKSIGDAGDVFFFYKRQIYTLSIYNVNGNWVPGRDFLRKKLDLTYVDELTGETVTGEKSLAELGWVDVGGSVIHLRYGAQLSVIRQDSVTEAFQQETDPLKYPFKSMGMNQYYFHGWYMDQENIVAADWTVNALQTMIQDQVLYTGWTTPQYRIVYALNGGTWTDRIDMTFMIRHIDGNTPVVLYYPHMTSDPNAEMYWYVPVKESDYLYMRTFYIARVGEILDMEHAVENHYPLKWDTLEDMIKYSSHTKDPGISSGGAAYLCHMGESVAESKDISHTKYVNRHARAGSILPEPSVPVRNGYDFLGWYAFDEAGATGFTQKVWLDTVLGAGEGIHSYKEEYVYIDSSGNAHLLYDDNGRLYYYNDQNGYHYRFQFGASVASQDRTLYAAWKGQQVNESRTMYLVPKNEIANAYVDSNWEEVTINGVAYYQVFDTETQEGVEFGASLVQQAKPLTTIGDGRIWLPEKATIRLDFGNSTPDGTKDRDQVFSHDGTAPVFKVRIPNLDKEAYTYYAYFIYHPVDKPTYTIHYIDLTEAVVRGKLRDYDDRFDRSNPPIDTNLILKSSQTVIYDGNQSGMEGIVTVRADVIEGYTVYENWIETLQLESDPSGNNIYFYYVNPKNNITFQITYHFMKDGAYSDDNMVQITGYPGIKGQQFSLRNVTEGYERILELAGRMRGYAQSGNQAEKDLYDRYSTMKIKSSADGVNGMFGVDVSAGDTLHLDDAIALAKDYVLDRWTPVSSNQNQTVTLDDGLSVDVYLKDGSIMLNKKDSHGSPLKGAEFELVRFRRLRTDEMAGSGADVITYEGMTYIRDERFSSVIKESGEDGKVVFYDLSTDAGAGYLYRIIEKKAPPGHTPIADPVYAKVPYKVTAADGTSTLYYDVTYDIVNPGVLSMPKTGGGGVFALLFAGGGLLTGGLLMGDVRYKKRKRTRRRNAR